MGVLSALRATAAATLLICMEPTLALVMADGLESFIMGDVMGDASVLVSVPDVLPALAEPMKRPCGPRCRRRA